MRLLKLICLAALPLTLGACQGLFKPEGSQSMASTHQRWEHRAPGCTGADCALVNIDLQLPKDDPLLAARIEHDLLELTRELPGDPVAKSLQIHERDFLATAQPGWTSYLQAKIIEQHDRLVIIELSSYRFTGGAHGVPGRAFINYDRQLKKVLTLQDMLVPGEETAFWDAARLAHQAWLATRGYADDSEFQKTWPFERTANIGLLYGTVMLKYDVDRIAPYSLGHPEVKIPYSRLNGILKPYYFPGRG